MTEPNGQPVGPVTDPLRLPEGADDDDHDAALFALGEQQLWWTLQEE